MAGITDFIQINSSAVNQETDASYQTDPIVVGGAVSGPYPPQSFNKTVYQLSTMIAALAHMLTLKNYSPVDGSSPFTAAGAPSTAVVNLAIVLQNLITNFDLQNAGSPYAGMQVATPLQADSSHTVADTAFVKIQKYVASNLLLPQLIQRGNNGGGSSVVFAQAFSSIPEVTIGMEQATANITPGSITVNGFSLNLNFGGQIVHWIAIGNL